MGKLTSLPRPILIGAAALFGAVMVLYSAVWMYYIRQQPTAGLGVSCKFSGKTSCLHVSEVREGTAAHRAGLQPGDHIRAINGQPMSAMDPYYNIVTRGRPGDEVRLTVERAGESEPIELSFRLGPRSPSEPFGTLTTAQAAALKIISFYPLPFLAVGLVVLFFRVRDSNAWMLALLFGGFLAGPPVPEATIHPSLRAFALSYSTLLGGFLPGVFYYFFAVFPAPSPLDRRVPWLKRGYLVTGAIFAFAWWWLSSRVGSIAVLAEESLMAGPLGAVYLFYAFSGFGLGLGSLVGTSLRSPSAEARRKARVIVYGAVAALTPVLLLGLVAISTGAGFQDQPIWVIIPVVMAQWLLPLSFAYAVLKHRVLELPVLLKRSARYFLVQRGFTILLVWAVVGITIVFTTFLWRLVEPWACPESAVPGVLIAGAGFGLLSVWAGRQVGRQVTSRIDRAFFRSAYDARLILEDLGEKARTAANRKDLVTLLECHLREALQPSFLAVYLKTGDGSFCAELGGVPSGLETIPSDLPALREVARRGRPCYVPPAGTGDGGELSTLASLHAECLVPMLGRDERLMGLVALGLRLSEEPYSREDKRLLASVASQAGIALESIGLAENIAERMEAERRAEHEMSIAREVQGRLFPRRKPEIATLDYAGGCIQARAVGGDYYDFLDFGPGELGLVLGDVVGKGISAALMMATLQANLRSQYAVAREDIGRMLETVNRLFYDSTAENYFVTLFFAYYEEQTRRLRYANCGHNPPVLLRTDGAVERLTSTATVLGLFEDWTCSTAEVTLAPGDTLVAFTDGVPEAASDQGEMFGDDRLIAVLKENRNLPSAALLDAVTSAVERFSGREQEDDITLLVARAL